MDDEFGDKAADFISLHLDLCKPAPVSSNMIWGNYIPMEAKSILDRLSSVQARYLAFLPENALAAIGELQNNPLLNMFTRFSGIINSDASHGITRPVFNFTPLENLKPIMTEMLISVKTVQKESERLNAVIVPQLSKVTFRDDFRPKTGDARFEGMPGPGVFTGNEPPASY